MRETKSLTLNQAPTTVLVYGYGKKSLDVPFPAFLFGDSIDEIYARWTPAEGTAWYLTDHLGTVHAIVDNAGALATQISYGSFGQVLSVTDPSVVDRYLYTGREFDADLDLYYYRARMYDAASGRFTSEDPIGFAAGDTNLQRYVGNSPTTAIDPEGLTTTESSTLKSRITGTIAASVRFLGQTIRCVFQEVAESLLLSFGGDAGGIAESAVLCAVSAGRGGGGKGSGGGGSNRGSNSGGSGGNGGGGSNRNNNGPGGGGRSNNNDGPGGSGNNNNGPGGGGGNGNNQDGPTTGSQGSDPSPRTPVGRSREQSNFPNSNAPKPRNGPTVVNGREFSGHAIDRMQERGFVPSVVENAINTGTRTAGNQPNTTVFFDAVNKIRVVVNSLNGRVVTVFGGKG